jgi:D-alanyl-D-alanine carboxypeptidase
MHLKQASSLAARSLIIVGLCLIVVMGWWAIKTQTKPVVLGVITPLSDDELRKSEQYQLVLAKKTTDQYPLSGYFPKSLTPRFSEKLDINTKAYAVMDRSTGELLLEHNLTEGLPIASVTKIMTAVVALEHADLNLEIKVSSAAASIGEATMGLTPGELVTVEELLYGMMLPSGNDAAEMLAEGLQGGRTNYINAMNRKAQELGLLDSFFFNPSGLDGATLEASNFSTCLDLLALTNYALTNPTFAQTVASHYKEFPYKEGKHKAFYLANILQLDWSYPGIRGVKPGITDFAGETLVSYAELGGKQVIVILLGTEHSKDDVVKVYDAVFKHLGIMVPGR